MLSGISISYWVAAFHAEDLLKCLYFADTTEREDRGWKEAQRQGEERVTLQITLIGTKQPEKFLEQKVKKFIIRAKNSSYYKMHWKFQIKSK
jgi:hypothetical protein